MNNISKTDWEEFDRLTDDEIDTSDIPELGDEFFANAKLRLPAQHVLVAALHNYGLTPTDTEIVIQLIERLRQGYQSSQKAA